MKPLLKAWIKKKKKKDMSNDSDNLLQCVDPAAAASGGGGDGIMTSIEKNDDNDGINNDSLSLPDNQEEAAPDSTTNSTENNKNANRFCCVFKYILSVIFIVFNIYAFVAQFDDTDSVGQWSMFYLLNAVLAIIGFISLLFVNKLIPNIFVLVLAVTFAVGMVIWSIANIVITSTQLSNTEPGGPTLGGDDKNTNTQRKEIALEVVGSCVGFLSALFNLFLLYSITTSVLSTSSSKSSTAAADVAATMTMTSPPSNERHFPVNNVPVV